MKTKLTLALFRWVGRWPLGVTRTVGAGLGRLMWWCQIREARTTRINIEHCFPELSAAEQKDLARRSVIELGKAFFEVPMTMQRSAEWVHGKVLKVHNQELLDQALADERGVLLVIPHLGNWEVIGMEVGRQTKMTSLYEPSRYPEMDEIVKESRSKLGADLVPTDKRGVMALIKSLRAGGTAAILPDQEPALDSGEFAPFFGMSALTMTLLSKLLQRSGAQALLNYVVRVPGGFEVFYQKPSDAIYDTDVSVSLAAMNADIEQIVRAAPAQYQWEYKRFKRRPEGMEKIYPQGAPRAPRG